MKRILVAMLVIVAYCLIQKLPFDNSVSAQSNITLQPGEMFVSEANTSVIKKISADGSSVTIFMTGFNGPRGITREADGSLVTVEVVGGTLRRLGVDGSNTIFVQGMNTPAGIAVDIDNHLIVTEDQNPWRLWKIAPDGSSSTVLAIGLKSEAVKIDRDGNYILVREDTGSLLKLTRAGQLSTIISGLARPTGLTIDAQGDYIIAEYDAGRLRRVKLDGSSSIIVNDLTTPNKVEVAPNGDLIVSELTTHTLKRVTAGSSSSTIFCTGIITPDHIYIQPFTAGRVQFSSAVDTVNEDAGVANITVTRVDGLNGAISVNYATSNGNAVAGSDYMATTGTLNFATGETTKSFTIPIIDDTMREGNETINITLSNAIGGAQLGNPSTAVLTIIDNDSLPLLSINNVMTNEGNNNPTVAIFNITLSNPSSENVTVGVRTVDDTAVAPGDYATRVAQVSFPPGSTSRTATIQIVPDTVVEPDEQFKVALSNPTNATIADGEGIGTILNDDNGSGGGNNPLPTLSINDVQALEGDSGSSVMIFNITLSSASSQTVTVGVRTVNDTAMAPSDYVGRNARVNFPPGSISRTATIQIVADTIVEPNENFKLILINPINATIADGEGAGLIINDEEAPCSPLPTGLISWWRAEQNSLDEVGGNHGTLQNGANFTVGKVGSAFNFDGIDDYVFIGNPDNLKLSNGVTLCAWVKVSGSPSAGQLAAIVTKWGQSSITDAYGLWLNNFNDGLRVNGGIGIVGTSDPGFRDGNVPIGEWGFVAMTYNSAIGINRLYLNGLLVLERSWPGGIAVSDLNVLIGKEDSFLPRYFQGAIDEVQIYNRALSAAELQAIFNADSNGNCLQ